MIRYLAALILAVSIILGGAQAEPPQSAFGITVGTPVDTLPVITVSPENNVHIIEDAPVPLDDPFVYGVIPAPDGGVCDVVAHTPDLPTPLAGAVKARLYLHLSSRHGPPWKTGRSPPVHIWKPDDGTAKRIDLVLMRRTGERETVFIRYYFAGPEGAPCYPGQSD